MFKNIKTEILKSCRVVAVLIILMFMLTSIWSQQPTKIFKIPGVDVSFVLKFIPAGEFDMGSAAAVQSDDDEDEDEDEDEDVDEYDEDEDDEEAVSATPADEDAEEDEMPLRRINISKGFYILKHEVTQKEWKAVMGKDSNKSFFLGDDRPVDQVSWFDCIKFLNKLSDKMGFPKAYDETSGKCISKSKGFRLPTEAEWEYSCKSGSTGIYKELKTDDVDEFEKKLKAFGVFGQSLTFETNDVEQLLPNPWGLYDMHGNVFEWCNDWYAPYGNTQLADPVGPSRGTSKVLRGGGLGSPYYDIRAVNRGQGEPDGEYDDTGFRFVLPVDDENH